MAIERGPDFLIVGAPRSGTTAMAAYLGAHERVWFTAPKEPHFFGSDLRIETPFKDERRYRMLFRDAGSRLAGEGSVFYLLSTAASGEIAEHNPEAKIIAMLRNPVDVMYSLYWNNLRDGRHEHLDRFEEALAAESARKQGIGIPSTCTWPDALRYRDVVRYPQQLQRFLGVFGADRVHIVIYDDFLENTEQAYRSVLKFLDLEPPHRLPHFGVVNPNRTWRSKILRDVRSGKRMRRLRRLAGSVLSDRAKASLSRTVQRVNLKVEERPSMDSGLRQSLIRDCASEVRDLELLLGRRLTAWLPGEG